MIKKFYYKSKQTIKQTKPQDKNESKPMRM